MRKLRFIVLSFICLAGLPVNAWATMAVIDTSAIAKLTDQLSKMQKQIEALTGISKKIQDQIDAVGKFGKITLPFINATKIASQIRQDVQCLKPDLSKIMPSVEFEDMDWNSVCQAGSAYRKTLWLDPEKFNQLPSWREKNQAARAVEDRRENVLSHATESGLALGDIAAQDVEKTNKAADELDTAVNAADTEREHIATIAKGQVLLIRTMTQQNQILAQMLKVQSAFALKAGLSVESMLSKESDKNSGGGQ
ncbi:MAG: hypothetical protein JKY27_05400 [Magnetovibrio sp.]|nr:hypothetical protein [Magnetovibrio sp.]